MPRREPGRRTATSWAAFLADRRGGSAILLAISFPVLIGGLALGAEAGYWFLVQRSVQQAADLAAHAAVVNKRAGGDEAQMRDAALRVAAGSGYDGASDTLSVHAPPLTGAFAGDPDAVEVRVRRSQERYFTLIYAEAPVPIGARGVAALTGGASACLLALSETAPGAVSVSGSTQVTFDGCDIASNSAASDSFLMSGGAAVVSTGCVSAVGGAITTAGLTLTDCPSIIERAPPAADPYAGVAEPDLSGSCRSGNVGTPSGVTYLTPTESHSSGVDAMRFCSGLTLSGEVVLAPGLYLVEGGDLRINSNARISGDDVTFFLAGDAEARFNGTASLDLSAPSSGPFAGLLIFGARDGTGAQHRVNGTADSELSGAVYTPAGSIDFTGDFTDSSGGCLQVIASTILFSGNSTLSVACDATPVNPIRTRLQVRLVE